MSIPTCRPAREYRCPGLEGSPPTPCSADGGRQSQHTQTALPGTGLSQTTRLVHSMNGWVGVLPQNACQVYVQILTDLRRCNVLYNCPAASVPSNSTVWLDCFDSSLSYSSTLIFQVNDTTSGDQDGLWCLSTYPEAAAASPGVDVIVQQAAVASQSISSSTYNVGGPTSSSSSYNLAPSRGAASSANGTPTPLPSPKQYGDVTGTIAGLSISVGVLSLAFLILLFLHIRLKKKFNRSLRGQATIGKWSKRHFDDDAKELDTEKPWESFTIPKPQPTSSSSLFSSKKTRTPHAFSGESFFSSQSATTSRLSSFFENRSASRTGGNRNTGTSESSAINPFEEEDYSEISSTSGRSKTTYDISSSSKRHSIAETTISESNTIQSGTESHFSSSAHSAKASTVGGASAVSDEYYHRKKATTISPNTNKASGKPFLDPETASVSFRQ